jgi:hypothetical protein
MVYSRRGLQYCTGYASYDDDPNARESDLELGVHDNAVSPSSANDSSERWREYLNTSECSGGVQMPSDSSDSEDRSATSGGGWSDAREESIGGGLTSISGSVAGSAGIGGLKWAARG